MKPVHKGILRAADWLSVFHELITFMNQSLFIVRITVQSTLAKLKYDVVSFKI